MARVTVRMDEVLWQQARDAAVQENQSLSRFVAETVERKLDLMARCGEASGVSSDEPPTHSNDAIGKAPERDRERNA